MSREFVTDIKASYYDMRNTKQSIEELNRIATKSHSLADTILDEIMNMIDHNDLSLNLAEQQGLYKMIDIVRQHQACIIGILTNIASRE